MLLKGKVGPVNLSKQAELPVNALFLAVLTTSIEDMSVSSSRKPSTNYSPSGLNCIRQMYYKRVCTPPDKEPCSYMDVGMSDTGTRRHEAIQQVLLWMNTQNKRFVYIDVATYIQEKQKRGKCLNIVVQGTFGAETALYDKERKVAFRCDGIIYDTVGKKFYLFEFKNQISFKAAGKQSVDSVHHNQVVTYCALLDLDSAFVVYENRDTCELYCPEVYEVSEYDKQQVLNKIDTCESYVKKGQPPAVPSDSVSSGSCKWCIYKRTCAADAQKEAEVNANG